MSCSLCQCAADGAVDEDCRCACHQCRTIAVAPPFSGMGRTLASVHVNSLAQYDHAAVPEIRRGVEAILQRGDAVEISIHAWAGRTVRAPSVRPRVMLQTLVDGRDEIVVDRCPVTGCVRVADHPPPHRDRKGHTWEGP